MVTLSPRVSLWSLDRRYAHLAWVLAGAIIGFGLSAIFTGILELWRSWFVLAYVVFAVPFLIAYARWSRLDAVALVRRRWLQGIAGAVVVGAIMAWAVQAMDASPRPEALRLAFDIVWLGFVYGTLDALFLSVFPVVAVWRAFPDRTATVRGKVSVGVLALVASMVVTASYHAGFVEFRDADMRSPLLANALFTFGYLLTTNPITAVVGHVVLHGASVLHGAGTTISLPPHY